MFLSSFKQKFSSYSALHCVAAPSAEDDELLEKKSLVNQWTEKLLWSYLLEQVLVMVEKYYIGAEQRRIRIKSEVLSLKLLKG